MIRILSVALCEVPHILLTLKSHHKMQVFQLTVLSDTNYCSSKLKIVSNFMPITVAV
jgi:hypothetical protein